MIFSRTAWQAATTAGATLGTVDDPPDPGAGGNVLSPSSNRTCSTGTPSVSAATCDITVYVPVPRSWVPDCTSTLPSAAIRTLTCAGR